MFDEEFDVISVFRDAQVVCGALFRLIPFHASVLEFRLLQGIFVFRNSTSLSPPYISEILSAGADKVC